MCFVLYLASRSEAPRVLWAADRPAFWTGELPARDVAVRSKFTLPCVSYVGSDLYCGCGFRNAAFQTGSWPQERRAAEPDYDPGTTQANHAALVAFLRRHFPAEPFVELFGCWGEPSRVTTTEDRQEIALSQIAEPRFHFRDRAYYRVNLAA
jgi:hypothetical protein